MTVRRSRTPGATALLVAVLVAVGLTGGCAGPGREPSAAEVRAVGLRLERAALTGAEQERARRWAAGYVADLVRARPELAGLRVAGIFPVFDEARPRPLGALARLVTPRLVPSIQLDLVRSRGERPEPVPSVVTNLRALDVIYEFAGDEVIFVGISPQPADAADPRTASVARPVRPAEHRDPLFADVD